MQRTSRTHHHILVHARDRALPDALFSTCAGEQVKPIDGHARMNTTILLNKSLTLQTMGKGDKKTKKGKRTIGSRGKSRPAKRTVASAKKAAAKKAAPKKAAPKKAAKKAAPKKAAAKKAAPKKK
jgi:ribosomal small subunit protein bTHX